MFGASAQTDGAGAPRVSLPACSAAAACTEPPPRAITAPGTPSLPGLLLPSRPAGADWLNLVPCLAHESGGLQREPAAVRVWAPICGHPALRRCALDCPTFLGQIPVRECRRFEGR